MVLSKTVAPPVKAKRSKDVAGPFRGMNRRFAGIENVPQAANRGNVKPNKARAEARHSESQDFKHLKMQKALASIPYGERAAIKRKISMIESFENFSLLPVLKEAVSDEIFSGLMELKPTPTQRVAIPALTRKDPIKASSIDENGQEVPAGRPKRKEYLIAAETGSGKTLSYLLPMLSAIKEAELVKKEITASGDGKSEDGGPGTNTFKEPLLNNADTDMSGRPKGIILVPTSELVIQVGKVAKALSHKVKLRVAMISSADSTTVIRNRLFAPGGIDLLISTPHLISSIAKSKPSVLSEVSHLVLDEADSLLDRSFMRLTLDIIDRSNPTLQQLIFCSATIPKNMEHFISRRFPKTERLVTPSLHAIPRRVQLSVIDIEKTPYHGNRKLACADILHQIAQQAQEQVESSGRSSSGDSGSWNRCALVFVNEREETELLSQYLRSKGLNAVALSRDTPIEQHQEILSAFTSDTSAAGSDKAQGISGVKRRDSPLNVLVTTDLGSRGVDTVAVRSVVLYEVPHTTIDFIHRLGRTGRMNRRGRGYVLVGKNDRKDIVSEVRHGMYKGQALI
jgi:ATP-dependent RNA helicase MRH4